jgi:hypothetical protein
MRFILLSRYTFYLMNIKSEYYFTSQWNDFKYFDKIFKE